MNSDHSKEPTFVVTRIFDAPRELVFKVWTECEHVKYWWGPKGFTAPYCKIDLRVGGVFHYCMRSPDGKEFWNKGIFREIISPEKIVSTMYFSDAEANTLKPQDYGMDSDFHAEMQDVVTFVTVEDNKTELTLRRNTPMSISRKFGEDIGWSQSLDKLGEELARVQK